MQRAAWVISLSGSNAVSTCIEPLLRAYRSVQPDALRMTQPRPRVIRQYGVKRTRTSVKPGREASTRTGPISIFPPFAR